MLFNYIYESVGTAYETSSTSGETLVHPMISPSLPVASPHVLKGLRIEFLFRGVAGCQIIPLLRLNNTDWEDVANTFDPHTAWCSLRLFYGHNPITTLPWTLADFLSLEIGLKNNKDLLVQIDTIEAGVVVEPTPWKTFLPKYEGYSPTWTNTFPAPFSTVLSTKDEDRSYISASLAGKIFSVGFENPLELPPEFEIEGINLRIRKSGIGEIEPFIRSSGINFTPDNGNGKGCPDDTELHTLEWNFDTSPLANFGNLTIEEIEESKFGFVNLDPTLSTISWMELDVRAGLIPEAITRLQPTGNGTLDDWSIGSPNLGEDPYEDLCGYQPNDISYVFGTAETPFHSSRILTVAITNPFSSADNIYRVKWVARIKQIVDGLPFANISPVFYKAGKTWVGKEIKVTTDYYFIHGTENYYLNPFTSLPWVPADFTGLEMGIAVTKGSAECSHMFLDVGTVPRRSYTVEDAPCSFTDDGQLNINRAIGDKLVWSIDRYEVGRGGFDQENPSIVLPIEPGDNSLADSFYEGLIEKTYSLDRDAYYWVVLPPEVFSETVGEIALKARIISSNNLGDVVGSYFTMAVAHFSGGFHTSRSIRVLKLKLTYSPIIVVGFDDTVTAISGSFRSTETVRIENDVLTASDSHSYVWCRYGGEDDTVTASDSSFRSTRTVRIENDNPSVVDGSSRSTETVRIENDTVTSSDGSSRSTETVRIENDNPSAVDGHDVVKA